ncbi:hypothetical protein RHGRI_020980 [Rhododendron griersonianum]|uniref:Uncharacterized protein n=1 Tax=Rhododendron griersonianum TaxID=479676 RepID=A0AAV6JLG7_9ERIC|nr:hypothetical protein RHGRI_020980 [Rhododendron griersonianum]
MADDSSGSRWILAPFRNQYWRERHSSPKDYYTGLRQEWAFRLEEQEGLYNDLQELSSPVPHRRVIQMRRENKLDYERAVRRIRRENNRMLLRRCRYYMLQLAREIAEASGRELTPCERSNVLANSKSLSDYDMSDEEV